MLLNVALSRFAELTQNSSVSDVEGSVRDVVRALSAGIEATEDLPSARREIANLLAFLQQMKKAKHPGRVALATALAEEVLPRLYENPADGAHPPGAESAPLDDYTFAAEEQAVLNRARELMGDVLRFLTGEDRKNPRRDTPLRDDTIPPLFAFSLQFQESFREIATAVARTCMRRKRVENQLYKPVRATLARDGQAGIQEHDEEIRKALQTAFASAQSAFRNAPAPGQTKAKTQKRAGTTSTAEAVAENDWLTMVETLETARVRSKAAGYFLPRAVDYDMLATVFSLNTDIVARSMRELGHAVTGAEDTAYVTRQIERLNTDLDQVHFDLSLLSAFMLGEDKERLSFKQMHDTCLGAASTREGIGQAHPLVVAELSRRPHQMARQLAEDLAAPEVSDQVFQQRLETFMRWIECLSELRFDQEIYGCVSQFWGKPAFKPLVKWIQDDKRDRRRLEVVLIQIGTKRAQAHA